MTEEKNKAKDPKSKPVAAASAGAPSAKKIASPESEAKASTEVKPSLVPKAIPVKPEKKIIPLRAKDEFPPDDEAEDDIDDELFEEEAEDAVDEFALDSALGARDTSERIILVVDEEGQRRNETVAIISQILPNAVIEVADDPEEAALMMDEGDFDTYVVNFLMPGYSSSQFVKAVANHPEHPLLIGFAADKMSDAVDPKKGLKIIPLKRLFDLDSNVAGEPVEGTPPEE